MIDLTLGLNSQATAVLHLVDYATRDQYVVSDYGLILTRAHYNGRERGYALVIQRWHSDQKALAIFFAEHRSTDGIVVQHEVLPVGRLVYDPPEFSDASYDGRAYFNVGDVNGAAEHVAKLIEAHLTRYTEKPPKQPRKAR